MRCLKCQTENPEGKRFCRGCGASLILVCPQCSSKLLPDDKFCGYCGHKLEEVAEMQIEIPQLAIGGARKQVSVLFSDLIGYTAISERLDPEELKELMSRIFGEIAQVVAKYEGFIDRFIGDAVLAFFGTPKVHEDDAVRAIKAAREIHDLVAAMSPKFEPRVGQPLDMHTGVDTGLVVIGGQDIAKGEHTIIGHTINLASRLSSLAKAGEILVSSDTYRLTEGYFTFQDLGPTDIKGKVEPVSVYKVLSVREKPVTTHRLSGLKSELIGRKVETAQLSKAVERLLKRQGTTFSIIGDAGMGKSRLIEEFKATLDLKEIQWVEGHAYAYCQNIPYSPIIDMINRSLQIREGDSPEEVRRKLESGIESAIGKREDVIPYIGSLYSLSYPELEGVDPEFWRNCLHKAMLEIISGIVQNKPTVIFLEDIHWADPSSMELIRYISSEIRYPVLILCVYRPHFSLFASHQITALGDSYQEIHIHDLSPSEAQDMMESLLQTRAIPHELHQFVQEKTEGNPFYLEEVVNSLIESETLIRDNGSWKLTRPLSEYGLPGTVQGIISARVDCLAKEVKRTLQEASVIGRAFLYRILEAVTELKEQVDQGLNELERLDLIRMRAAQPELEYIFKHALTQEIVYNGLLKKEREEIHERIGTVIEKLFPDRLPEFYETLAFHFKQSSHVLKAIDYLMKSGEKSLSRYAIEESHQYFKDAFDLLINKPNKSKEEEGLLIDLLIKWATVFHHRGDFKGLNELLMAHKNTAESLGDKTRLGMFYAWLGNALYCRQKLGDSYQYLRSALRLGEETQDQKVIAYANAFSAWCYADLGLIEEGILHGEKASEITNQIPLTTMDAFLHAHAVGGAGWSYWHRGDKKRVVERGETLLKVDQRHPNIADLAMGYWITGFGYELDGDIQSSIEYCKKAIQVSRHPWYSEFSRTLLGAMYVYQGQFQEAEDALRRVVTYSDTFGGEAIGTPARTYLGIVLIGKGNIEQGLKMIEESQRSYLEDGRKGLYALSEYILGKIYLQMVEKAAPITLIADKKAENHFNKAIEAAKEIGAKGTLGTAYLDLGLLHKTKGRTDKAKECLSEAIQVLEQCEIEVYLRQAREELALLE